MYGVIASSMKHLSPRDVELYLSVCLGVGNRASRDVQLLIREFILQLTTISCFYRILKNYTFQEGSLTTASDLLEYAEKEKERFEISSHLSRVFLGVILSDMWGDKVKRARRGPRGDQKWYYLNITHKQNQAQSYDDDLSVGFKEIAKDNFTLPSGWFKIVDNQRKISLVHPESCEFENQRIYTEISMELSAEKKFICVIKSHGNEVSLEDLKFQIFFEDLPVQGRAKLLLEFLESSSICLGCRVHGDTVITLERHKAGLFQSLTEPEMLPQNGAFSSKCKLIPCVSKEICTECSHLKNTYQQRRKRIEKRTSINKHCNIRYLTKEEIILQLKEERKLNKKLLQEQQESSASESEDDQSHASENSEDDDSSLHDSCSEEWMIRNDSKGLTLYRV